MLVYLSYAVYSQFMSNLWIVCSEKALCIHIFISYISNKVLDFTTLYSIHLTLTCSKRGNKLQ